MKLFEYTISTQLPDLSSSDKMIINTINPHSYCIAKKDDQFNNSLINANVLLPDGTGIVWAVKLLSGKKIRRIAGFDVFIHCMQYLQSTGGSCFFLGSSKETLKLIKEKVAIEYPDVKVGNYSPPYKAVFLKEDSEIMCKNVNSFKPDILFVGMTAPKQEKWVHSNNNKMSVNIICSIGAVFDFYAETVKRPSKFWIDSGLEWLPRFLKEPVRLARRNLISTPKFILDVLRIKFGFGN